MNDDLGALTYMLGLMAVILFFFTLYELGENRKVENEIKTLCGEVYKTGLKTDKADEICSKVDISFKDLRSGL